MPSMFRILFATLLAIGATQTPALASDCGAAGLTVSSIAVNGVTTGKLNTYHLLAKITNTGREAQAVDTLQFIDIFQLSDKLDAKGVPPLAPGQTYTVAYDVMRSPDAGNGTTTLTFLLDSRRPASANAQSCIASTGYAISF